MQDIERPMKGVDRADGAEIHPRRPLIDAVDRGVSVYRVEVEARDVLRFEDVADLVEAPAFCAMGLAVAVVTPVDWMDRSAAHEFGIARSLGLQIRISQRIDGSGIDAPEQCPGPSGLELKRGGRESGRSHSGVFLVCRGGRLFFGRKSEVGNQKTG